MDDLLSINERDSVKCSAACFCREALEGGRLDSREKSERHLGRQAYNPGKPLLKTTLDSHPASYSKQLAQGLFTHHNAPVSIHYPHHRLRQHRPQRASGCSSQ
jgi:hypothetical protein